MCMYYHVYRLAIDKGFEFSGGATDVDCLLVEYDCFCGTCICNQIHVGNTYSNEGSLRTDMIDFNFFSRRQHTKQGEKMV